MLGQVVLFGAIIAGTRFGPQWAGAAGAASSIAGLALIAAGLLLGVRGILDLGSNLTPFPRPKDDSRLVESGVYGLVRHPIYGGLILASLGAGLITASVPTLLAAAALALFFYLKSRREERWLAERFSDYPSYRGRTRRFVPWLF